jgi:Tol biopolymer transport system component
MHRVMNRAAPLTVLLVVLFMAAPAAADEGTPCGFDLFVLSGGVSRDLTNTPFVCEFRPEWSPSRQQVVYNAVGTQGLFVADTSTGVGSFLAGGEDGNNPSWSPDGQLITFDRVFVGDETVYVVPPSGGTRVAVTTDAVDADWAPNGGRIAFVRPSDGSIRTIGIDGRGEAIVAPAGSQSPCLPLECGLAWSPNGQLIAYSDVQNIWVVRVAPDGQPLGSPTLVLAGGPFFNTQLTWSGDSKTIAFNSDRAGDGGSGLWTVPASGGTPMRIDGTTSFFNYDPNIARGGGAIVYSGSTG